MNDSNEIINEKKQLINRVWITRCTRIKTADRLRKNYVYFEWMAAYYTISLSVFSIIDLVYTVEYISVINVILSVILMGLIYFSNGMNYKDRHLKMMKNYMNLDLLYYKFIGNNEINLNDMSKEYNEIISDTENHIIYDYLNYIKDEKQKSESKENKDKSIYIFYKYNKIKLHFYNIIKRSSVILSILVPLIILSYIIINI